MGFVRPNSNYGIRNHVLILSTVTCANHVVQEIARATGTIPVVHDTGCLQFGADLAQTKRTIVGCGQNPNVGAVLFVGLGCEQTVAKDLAAKVSGKITEFITIQACGGTTKAISKEIEIANQMKQAISGVARVECPVTALRVSLKCGGSDYTSALSSNPSVGKFSDLFLSRQAQECF